MRHQADASATWVWRWGEIVESARSRGQVTDAQWRAYLDESIRNYQTLLFRPKLRPNDPPAYVLRINGARLGRGTQWWYGMRVRSMMIDDRDVPLSKGWSSGTLQTWAGALHASYGDMREAQQVVASLAPGPHAGQLNIDLCVFEYAQQAAATTPSLPRVGPGTGAPDYHTRAERILNGEHDLASLAVTQEMPFTFTLVGADEEVLERVVGDAQIRDEICATVEISDVRLTGASLNMQVRSRSTKCDLAFEAFAVLGEMEIRLGTAVLPANSRSAASRSLNATLPRGLVLDPNTIDVILRPSAAVAMRRADITRYWGEELVFRDLPVDRASRAASGSWSAANSAPTSRPATVFRPRSRPATAPTR